MEVDDWEETIANLNRLQIPYSRSPQADAGPPRTPKNNPYTGRREDNGEYFTYVHDPDGNVIELVYHPLGLEDAGGNEVKVADNSKGMRWRQIAEFVASD